MNLGHDIRGFNFNDFLMSVYEIIMGIWVNHFGPLDFYDVIGVLGT